MRNGTSIASFARGAIELMESGHEIYWQVTAYMDAVESQGVLSGREKLDWVIAALADVIENFDYWFPKIIDLITAINTAYNAVRDLFEYS